MGDTPTRGVRMEGELWEGFGKAATAQGTDRATLIKEWTRWYLRKPGARRPQQATKQ